MQVKAKAKYIHIAPRKVRLVAGVVRGLDVDLALQKLSVMDKRSVAPVQKLLDSAIASAEHNYELTKNNLFIERIIVNDGPTNFRWMQKAFGRATPLRHRTSIIDIILAEKNPESKSKAKKKKGKEQIATEVIADEVKETKDIKKDDHKVAKHPGLRKGSEKSLIKKVFRRKTGM
ncbi:MAG: 50S ribosomal protein L22 [Parcubacteria group bacterium GW2011_GWC2_39_14]|nr:MAG: 50S ribosomal protein L22 [Parcubacteria group bacterium GW2011_GWC2_39_14]KKR55474.1 MAG: 50S ribosomal protein L22 [Parcubacteria group bacterium GW2011_GWA2_40_23]